MDVVRAYNEVSFVQEVLESARNDVESFHDRIYTAALAIARKVNVDESLPRTGRQQHRCNVPSASPSEYYKRQLTIPYQLLTISHQRFLNGFSRAFQQFNNTLSDYEATSTFCSRE